MLKPAPAGVHVPAALRGNRQASAPTTSRPRRWAPQHGPGSTTTQPRRARP